MGLILIRKFLSGLIGWKTKRKIVVIESDDWGSIRVRSKSDYDAMLNFGLNVSESVFTRYDSLEKDSDLERLFDILARHKDRFNNNAVFTPLCIVANPDFRKIVSSDFKEYHYEPLSETIKNYTESSNVIKLWSEGKNNKLFSPSFHGREHLNVKRWLRLVNDHQGVRFAFDCESFGISSFNNNPIPEYLGAFYTIDLDDIKKISEIAETGINLFRSILGYSPDHFLGPNREWPLYIDEITAKNNVKIITLSKLRNYPVPGKGHKIELNWLGKKNKFGQIVSVRNCSFEPVNFPDDNVIDVCLKEIDYAFKAYSPAIISTHRVNYVGRIDQKHADDSLRKLNILLKKILQRWPDVEFLSTVDLGNLILQSKIS